MKMRTFAVAAVATALAVPAAATAASPPQQVVLQVGDEATMSMHGNPSTGFTWRIKSVDRSILKLLSSKYVPAKHPPGGAGSGGTYVFRFRAVSRGRTVLQFAYTERLSPPTYVPIRVTVT